jgi:predicted nucleic acid-binding protein
LFLDTSVLIDALRERSAARRIRELRRAGEPRPLICAVNVEEIWRGARPGEDDSIRALIGALRIIPLGAREGELAGSWRRQFGAQGITLSQSDCLIAAAALSAGARIGTGNPAHFPMPELEVEHWSVGE